MDDKILQTYKSYHYPNLKTLHKILNGKFTHKQIKDVIDKQSVYQLHNKNIKKVSKKVVSFHPNEQWFFDLLDMSNYSRKNRGFKWILLGIDTFTRKGFVAAMKNKKEQTVLDAFEAIVEQEGEFPKVLFINKKFKDYLEKNKIFQITNEPGYHSTLGVIDRFSRTVKEKIFKTFTDYNTTNWVDILGDIINKYNDTPHTALENRKPSQAIEHKQEIQDLNIEKNNQPLKHRIEVGDLVRKKLKKANFLKGYKQIWSAQTYTIQSIRGVNAQLDNEEVVKLNLLQKVDEPDETVADLPTEFKHEKVEQKAKKSKPSKSEITLADVSKNVVEGKRKRKPKRSDDFIY